MGTRNVDNTEDVLDSRDIIARIRELESEREEVTGNFDFVEDSEGARADALAEWDDENSEELRILRALADEGESSPDWQYGETLIRDSYFRDYAEELAEDIGAISKDATWPNTYIDWEAAADALKQDYLSVDFDGVTYWIRA